MVEQLDGQLFTYTTKLDNCKLSFYLPDGTLTNYINVENKINLQNLHLRQNLHLVRYVLNITLTVFSAV